MVPTTAVFHHYRGIPTVPIAVHMSRLDLCLGSSQSCEARVSVHSQSIWLNEDVIIIETNKFGMPDFVFRCNFVTVTAAILKPFV